MLVVLLDCVPVIQSDELWSNPLDVPPYLQVEFMHEMRHDPPLNLRPDDQLDLKLTILRVLWHGVWHEVQLTES